MSFWVDMSAGHDQGTSRAPSLTLYYRIPSVELARFNLKLLDAEWMAVSIM